MSSQKEHPGRKKLNLGIKVINGKPRIVDLDDDKVISNAAVRSDMEDDDAVVLTHKGGETHLRLTLTYSHCDLDAAWPGQDEETPEWISES